MRDGDITRLNPYSLMSSPLDTRRIHDLACGATMLGRGGSLFMHGKVKPGRRAWSSRYPVNLFSLDLRAQEAPDDRRRHRHHALHGADRAAGGDKAAISSCTMPCRTASLGTYGDVLAERYGRRIHLYHDDRGEKIELDRLLSHRSRSARISMSAARRR